MPHPERWNCKHCGKPYTLRGTYKRCIPCTKAYMDKYYVENHAEIRSKQAEYQALNKELFIRYGA
jgi:transposase-like protein